MNWKTIEEFNLGELILALTQETVWLSGDKKTAYQVLAVILSDLLDNSEPASKSWH